MSPRPPRTEASSPSPGPNGSVDFEEAEGGFYLVSPTPARRIPPPPQPTSGRATPIHENGSLHVANGLSLDGQSGDIHDEESLKNDQPASNSANVEVEWDFILPVIPLVSRTEQPQFDEDEAFNLRDLVALMQNGRDIKIIQNYLNRFDEATVRSHVNGEVEGFPAMFYVVETNKEHLLRLWVGLGGDPCAVHKPSRVPLLAFAIAHSETIQRDTSVITSTLLSLGASPGVIPAPLYSPYLQDLPDDWLKGDSLKLFSTEHKSWCKGTALKKLTRQCNLSQRYHLERAAKTGKPSRRQQQVAQRMKAEPLLGIYNLLVESGKKPLVLVFAGPSGHGKTELARKLGHLLSLEWLPVDCTIVNKEMELFGSRHPYAGAAEGTQLNNFLAAHNGQRCIVFLDEFDKTSPDIHKALLVPFENGEYPDRRNSLTTINCSRTIWILATNAHDELIKEFATDNQRALSTGGDEAQAKLLLKQLAHQVRDDFRKRHGAPITGRISEFLPFLPFSIGEQAVMVHKLLLELGRTIQQPVNLTEGPDEKLVGNVRLRIRRDVAICRALAESEYHADLGARSLIAAERKIKGLIVREYLKVDEEITETGGMTDAILDMEEGEVVVRLMPSKV